MYLYVIIESIHPSQASYKPSLLLFGDSFFLGGMLHVFFPGTSSEAGGLACLDGLSFWQSKLWCHWWLFALYAFQYISKAVITTENHTHVHACRNMHKYISIIFIDKCVNGHLLDMCLHSYLHMCNMVYACVFLCATSTCSNNIEYIHIQMHRIRWRKIYIYTYKCTCICQWFSSHAHVEKKTCIESY